MAHTALTTAEIEEALQTLPEWQVRAGKLHKQFKFSSFSAAIGWMVTVAFVAEKINHHPEWRNVYNRVTVDLVTHDAGNAITAADLKLAKAMETAFTGRSV